MVDMSKQEVVKKITEEKGLSVSEVEEKIKAKIQQLSGLISEDGAAHIVANDLGVALYKTTGLLKMSELSPSAKSATIVGEVLRKYEVREFDKDGRKGRVANFMLGDETGMIRVVLWNDQVDLFAKLKEGDILRVSDPFIKENNGRLELHINTRSNIEQNPAGVSVKAKRMDAHGGDAASGRPARELKYLRDLQGDEENVEVLGTVVQVFDPRFFEVCPECNKRVRDGSCPEHGTVTPVMNYVTSCMLDDGTANIRTTFWKKQTQHLFGKSDEEILTWQADSSLAEGPKHDLLGEIIKVIGRVKKNEQFDRVELTASLVFTDVDPEKELARLEQKNEDDGDEEGVKGASGEADETPAEPTSPLEPDSPTTNENETAEETTTDEEEDEDELPAPEPISTPSEESEATPDKEPEFQTADELAVEEDVISIDDLEEDDEK